MNILIKDFKCLKRIKLFVTCKIEFACRTNIFILKITKRNCQSSNVDLVRSRKKRDRAIVSPVSSWCNEATKLAIINRVRISR